MIRVLLPIAAFTMATLSITAYSQQRGSGRIPAVGSELPSVTVFDEQGNEFSTSSLRGSYSVLVFGCLT